MACHLLIRHSAILPASSKIYSFLQGRSHQIMCVAGMSVWEKDKKGGYGKPSDIPMTKMVKDGVKMIGSEVGMFCHEVKEKFACDQRIHLDHGDYEKIWTFKDRMSVQDWVVTADHDNNEGFSQAHFTFSKYNTGLFHGHLSQQIPKDGVIKRTGYCNVRSPTKFMSFKRAENHDWTPFSHLLMRVRGDGRSYMITLGVDRFFDIGWHDQYHYPLYTRGGPYWQTAKIPFSKFYVTSKGRIQDKQEPVPLERITHLSISVGDGYEGPFYLELETIAVMYDENHDELFAYETYETDPAYVNT